MKLQQDLREFIELLHSTRVKYVLVGGHAVAHHGFPRFTGDIDFFVETSRDNIQALGDCLCQFGFPTLGREILGSISPGTMVQLGRPPHRIDLLTSIDGVTFDEAWETRVTTVLDGLELPVLSRALLIRNKQASGRPKDLEDLRQLQR